ncbi:MAG: hypothetical protein A4S09_08745 [Proteobacteria bacterium SG_bin7]|nr:MAG: hypothetical protein A4S09_08745 [Proteobacteria bacterium SG_bin7]
MADNVFVFENKFRVKPVDKYFSPQGESVNLTIRFLAFLFDSFVIFTLLFFVELFLGAAALQAHENFFKIVVMHFIYWGIPAQTIAYVYYCFFYLSFGATPGKLVLGLRVVSVETGGDLSLIQIFLREILGKFFSFFFFGFGFLLSFFRKDGRALHDLISGSRVVSVRQKIPRGL